MKRKTHKREVASDSSRIKTELQNELVFAKNAGNRKAPVLMTPQIASQIEEKSREWEKVVKMFLMPNLPAKKYSLAEMLNLLPGISDVSVRVKLGQYCRLSLNNLEMAAIDDMPCCCDLHSSIASTLMAIRRKYLTLSDFVDDFEHQVWWLDWNKNTVVRFHENFWLEVYVKHPSATFDYPILMRHGFFVVQFVSEWPQTDWMNEFMGNFAKSLEKDDFYLYRYDLSKH